MSQELNYHFHAEKGWMNDPNGLCYFKGQYHLFFQHNPFSKKWDRMHWGHAVSQDMIKWEYCPIALTPDEVYEDEGGCFSGSAVVVNDRLYLFYTAVSAKWGQSQCMAWSDDGFHFEKYQNNPIIQTYPEEGSIDFRDPKVFSYRNEWYMVLGSGKDGVGKVLLYKSSDLFQWRFVSVLLEGDQYGNVIECPDFFQLEDRWVLVFSQMNRENKAVVYAVGDFDGSHFIPQYIDTPEYGPQFYAPQSFLAPDGRRIQYGWMYEWNTEAPKDQNYCGALTVPRQLTLTEDHHIRMFPIREYERFLKKEDPNIRISEDSICISALRSNISFHSEVQDLAVLRDGDSFEIFINQGEHSFTIYQQ